MFCDIVFKLEYLKKTYEGLKIRVSSLMSNWLESLITIFISNLYNYMFHFQHVHGTLSKRSRRLTLQKNSKSNQLFNMGAYNRTYSPALWQR